VKLASKHVALSADATVPSPVAMAQCSLCRRVDRLGVLVVQQLKPFRCCGDCRVVLWNALEKARLVMAGLLLGDSLSPERRTAAFEDVYRLGVKLQGAVELSKPHGPGRHLHLALQFAVAVFFHHSFTNGEIRPLVEAVLGRRVGERYVERLIADSPLPISTLLRETEPQRPLLPVERISV
jgi:hypothetical protein